MRPRSFIAIDYRCTLFRSFSALHGARDIDSGSNKTHDDQFEEKWDLDSRVDREHLFAL